MEVGWEGPGTCREKYLSCWEHFSPSGTQGGLQVGGPSAWQARQQSRLGAIHHTPTLLVQVTQAALAGALLRDPAWGPAGVGRADGQEPKHNSN